MRRTAWLLTIPLMACSARNCDNDALQSPTTVTTGGQGGVPGAGGSTISVGGDGGGGFGGNNVPGDCDGDGVIEDLLSNNLHCGVCDHACGDLEFNDCIQGSCVVAIPPQPAGLTVQGNFLYYWHNISAPPDIWRVPVAGGAEELHLMVLPSDEVQYDLELHGDVFFGMLQSQVVKLSTVMAPQLFAATTASIHFAKLPGMSCWGADATITCNDPDGGGSILVNLDAPPVGMTDYGGDLYWLDETGSLYRSTAGAMSGDLVAEGFPVFAEGQIIVVDDVAYAVSDQSVWMSNAIYNATQTHLATDIVAIPGLTDPGDIVFNAGWLYFTHSPRSDGQFGAVYRVRPETPDNLQTIYLTESSGGVPYLATSGQYVFFSALADSRILRHHVEAELGALP